MHIALVVLASAISIANPPSPPPAADTAKPRTSGATLGIKAPVPQNSSISNSSKPNTLNVDVPASEVLKEAKAAKLAAKQKSRKAPEIRGETTSSPKTKAHKKHAPGRQKTRK